MGLLKHIRSRSKVNQASPEAKVYPHHHARDPSSSYNYAGHTPPLPEKVLKRIFGLVCPHALDESYDSCEESAIEDVCMLCDMRDLAHCARVNRAWAEAAESILYHSIRLDAVHYCDREPVLAEKRKRHSWFDRNADPIDATQLRLQLFSRTAWENERLAILVELLKMPYMTRESSKADLARTVAVLPNLRYIDLPDGFYSDEQSCVALKQETQHKCPDIRKMKYVTGSEASFTMLAHTRQWQSLQILELRGLHVEPDTLLYVLASFPILHELSLTEIPALEDAVFVPNPMMPPFPPLQRLQLSRVPSITAGALIAYLSRPDTREVLTDLDLAETGIAPQDLHLILNEAPNLRYLRISEEVSRSFPLNPIPALTSRTLQTLHYEILPATNAAPPPNSPSESYYTYLASCLLSGSLPSLNSLFAFSSSLPDHLLFPPIAPFGGGARPGSSYSSGHGSRDPSINKEYGASNRRPSQQQQYTNPSARFSAYSVASSHSGSSNHSGAPPSHNPPSVLGPPSGNPSGANSITNFNFGANSHTNPTHHSQPAFAPANTLPSLAGLSSTLHVYTKSALAPELEWSLTIIDPPSERNGRRGSATATRPVSLFDAKGSAMATAVETGSFVGSVGGKRSSSRHSSRFGGNNASHDFDAGVGSGSGSAINPAAGRESVFVGNGFGGFLAVPGEEAMPQGRRGSRVQGMGNRGEGWMG